MPISARWSVPVPQVSLPTWVFTHPTAAFSPPSDASKPAYVDTSRPDTHVLTFSSFRLLAKRLALGLLQHPSFKPGDRILVVANNSIFYPAVILGIMAAGGVFTGASPAFKTRELAHQLLDSGASMMLAAPETLDTATAAAKETGLALQKIYLFDDSSMPGPAPIGCVGSSVKHWTHLLADPALAEPWSWPEPANPQDTTCCLNYSSGTTGLPKGVEITHGAYVANGAVAVSPHGWLNPSSLVMTPGGRVDICILPLYHVYSQTTYAANTPHVRTTTYVMSRPEFPRLLAAVEQFRITHLALVPPILTAIAKSPLARKHDLSSLVSMASGAAPLSKAVARDAQLVIAMHQKVQKKATPSVWLRQGWGMTEMTCIGSAWAHDTPLDDVASVGELAANCRAKLVSVADGATEITTARTPGEIWITGPTMMRGYWRNPSATASAIVTDPADGATRWLRTGDVGFFDGPNGFAPGALLYIVDRVKELIKVKGRQVAPAELEAVLLGHGDVIDAAVIGVSIGGEEMPRAYVVLSPAAAARGAKETEISAWMADKVAGYKKLAGGLVFVDAIPKTPSGKILRRELRKRATVEVGDRKSRGSRLS